MPEEVQQTDTTPSPESAAPTEQAISFDVDDLLGVGIDPTASAEPAPETPPEGDDGPGEDDPADGDPLEDADDTDTTDDAANDTPPEQRIFDFASIVAQNVNRIAEVPKKQQPEVIKALLSAAYMRGKNDSGSEFQQQSSAEERLRAFVTERSETRKTDPDGFATWEDEHPADAARFHQGAAHFKDKAAQPAEEPQTVNTAAIQQRANAKLERVSTLPDGVREQFVARVQSGEFPLTEAGLDAMDDALFAASRAPAPVATKAPTVARRQAAADARDAAPRAKGVGSGGQPVPESIYDPDELFAMSR